MNGISGRYWSGICSFGSGGLRIVDDDADFEHARLGQNHVFCVSARSIIRLGSFLVFLLNLVQH